MDSVDLSTQLTSRCKMNNKVLKNTRIIIPIMFKLLALMISIKTPILAKSFTGSILLYANCSYICMLGWNIPCKIQCLHRSRDIIAVLIIFLLFKNTQAVQIQPVPQCPVPRPWLSPRPEVLQSLCSVKTCLGCKTDGTFKMKCTYDCLLLYI